MTIRSKDPRRAAAALDEPANGVRRGRLAARTRRWAGLSKNGLWLTLPPLLFSLSLMGLSPTAITPARFDEGIPAALVGGETLGRAVVFAMPAFFSVGLSSGTRRRGLALYLVGLALYGLSYGTQNLLPGSPWSTSLLGFSASAYTNVFWMVGLGLMGERFCFPTRLRYRPVFYIAPAIVFAALHTTHAVMYFRGAA